MAERGGFSKESLAKIGNISYSMKCLNNCKQSVHKRNHYSITLSSILQIHMDTQEQHNFSIIMTFTGKTSIFVEVKIPY